MQGKGTQEVCDIIEESRQESQIELIVSRPLTVNRRNAQQQWRQSHSPIRAQHRQYLQKGSHRILMLNTVYCTVDDNGLRTEYLGSNDLQFPLSLHFHE